MNPKKVLTTAGLIVALGGVVANTVAFSIKCNELDQKVVDVRNELEEVNGATRKDLLKAVADTRKELNDVTAEADKNLSESIKALKEYVENAEEELKVADTALNTSLFNSLQYVMGELTDVEDALALEGYNRSTSDSELESELGAMYSDVLTRIGNVMVQLNNVKVALETADQQQLGLINQNASDIDDLNTALENAKTQLLNLINGLQAQIDEIKSTYATKVELETVRSNLQTAIDALDTKLTNNYYTKTEVDGIKAAIETAYKGLISELRALVEDGGADPVETEKTFKGLVELTTNLAKAESDIKAIQDDITAFRGEAAAKAKAEAAGALARRHGEFMAKIQDFEDRCYDEDTGILPRLLEVFGDDATNTEYKGYVQTVKDLIKSLTKKFYEDMADVETQGEGYVILAKNSEEAVKVKNEYLVKLDSFAYEGEFTIKKLEAICAVYELPNLVKNTAKDDDTVVVGDYSALKTGYINGLKALAWDGENFAKCATAEAMEAFYKKAIDGIETKQEIAVKHDALVGILEETYAKTKSNYNTSYGSVETEINTLAETACDATAYATAMGAESVTTKAAVDSAYASIEKAALKVKEIAIKFIDVLNETATQKAAIAALDPLKTTDYSTAKGKFDDLVSKVDSAADLATFAAGMEDQTYESATDVDTVVAAVVAQIKLDEYKASVYNGLIADYNNALSTIDGLTLWADAKTAYKAAAKTAFDVDKFITATASCTTNTEVDNAAGTFKTSGISDVVAMATNYEVPVEAAIDELEKVIGNTTETTADKTPYLTGAQRTALGKVHATLKAEYQSFSGTGNAAAIKATFTSAAAAKTIKETATTGTDAVLATFKADVKAIDNAQHLVGEYNEKVNQLNSNFMASWLAAGHTNQANWLVTDHVDDGTTIATDSANTGALASAYATAGSGSKALGTIPDAGTKTAEAIMTEMASYVAGLPTSTSLGTEYTTFETSLKTLRESMDTAFAAAEKAYCEQLLPLMQAALTTLKGKVIDAINGSSLEEASKLALIDKANGIDNAYQTAAPTISSSDAFVESYNKARAAYKALDTTIITDAVVGDAADFVTE